MYSRLGSAKIQKMCEEYLLKYHKDPLLAILEDKNVGKSFSLTINFLELFENNPKLGNTLLQEPEEALDEWNSALLKSQNALILRYDGKDFLYKSRIYCRFFELPNCSEWQRTEIPTSDDHGRFLQMRGTVVRATAAKIVEFRRKYICLKCRNEVYVEAFAEKHNVINAPKRCDNSEEGCEGGVLIRASGDLDVEFCKDYQEVKIQDNLSTRGVVRTPDSIWVTLEGDLVNSCKPGDDVTICGVVKRRWGPLIPGKFMQIDLILKANSIQVNNCFLTCFKPEQKTMFESFWKTYDKQPLSARDIILKSIGPDIFGMHLVKLAVAVVLAGGSQINTDLKTGVRTRCECHLLLVGDPGTGKSELLRFASRIVPRSVLTTGVGSTAAGLTATAVMEGGEWQLEAGALVLADGGICCIDEFNSMKEHDRTSIHEAMEQQTISVAKASMVCKLSTRCTVLAATNPKGGNIDPSQSLMMNVALATPLLSRFDLILLIRDKVDRLLDELVADFMLNLNEKETMDIHWDIETLQAYFSVVKKLQPVLTEDSNKILGSYYQAQRRKNVRNESRTTVRLLDSLVRLSQGHARLMYHEEVGISDAVYAIVLVEAGMEAQFSLFDLQFDVMADFPHNPADRYRKFLEVVLTKLQLHDLLRKEVERIDKGGGGGGDFAPTRKIKLSESVGEKGSPPKRTKREIASPVVDQPTSSGYKRQKIDEIDARDVDSNKREGKTAEKVVAVAKTGNIFEDEDVDFDF